MTNVIPILRDTTDPTTISDITTAMTTALTTTGNNVMDAIAAIVPVALGIVGAIIVVTVGIRIFKRITGR